MAQPWESEDSKDSENKKDSKDSDTEEYLSYYVSCPEEFKTIIETKAYAIDKEMTDLILLSLEVKSILIEEGLKALPPKNYVYTSHRAHKLHWSASDSDYVIPGPWKENVCFYIDLFTGEAFRVDQDTDNLTDQEIIDNWAEVEAADRKELKICGRKGVEKGKSQFGATATHWCNMG